MSAYGGLPPLPNAGAYAATPQPPPPMYTAPQYGVVNVPSGNVGPSSSMGALGSPQPPMMAVGVGDAAAGPGGAFGRGLPPIDAQMATQVGLAYGARGPRVEWPTPNAQPGHAGRRERSMCAELGAASVHR